MERCRRCGMNRTAQREGRVADSEHSGVRDIAGASDPADRRTEASALESARREHLRRNGEIRTDEEAVRCVVAMQEAVPRVKLDRLSLTRDRGGGNYTLRLDGIRIQELLPVWQPPRWLLAGEPRRMRAAGAAMRRQRARSYIRGKAERDARWRPRRVLAARGSRCRPARTRQSVARSQKCRRSPSSSLGGGGPSGSGESGSSGEPPARSNVDGSLGAGRSGSAGSETCSPIECDGERL